MELMLTAVSRDLSHIVLKAVSRDRRPGCKMELMLKAVSRDLSHVVSWN